MEASSSPVTTSSFNAASTTLSCTASPVIASYASKIPTSAAVPEIGFGPATMISASVIPAVVSAFLYIPTVQYVILFVEMFNPFPFLRFTITTEDQDLLPILEEST